MSRCAHHFRAITHTRPFSFFSSHALRDGFVQSRSQPPPPLSPSGSGKKTKASAGDLDEGGGWMRTRHTPRSRRSFDRAGYRRVRRPTDPRSSPTVASSRSEVVRNAVDSRGIDLIGSGRRVRTSKLQPVDEKKHNRSSAPQTAFLLVLTAS